MTTITITGRVLTIRTLQALKSMAHVRWLAAIRASDQPECDRCKAQYEALGEAVEVLMTAFSAVEAESAEVRS